MTDWDGDEIPLPGTRPRRGTGRAVKEDDEVEWDLHPRVYRLHGQEQECFPVSALAVALNRTVPTMYSWERKGWLPPARSRSPRVDDINGHRLYSREFIEGVVKIARSEGLFKKTANGRPYPIEKTNFAERVAELMEEVGW